MENFREHVGLRTSNFRMVAAESSKAEAIEIKQRLHREFGVRANFSNSLNLARPLLDACIMLRKFGIEPPRNVAFFVADNGPVSFEEGGIVFLNTIGERNGEWLAVAPNPDTEVDIPLTAWALPQDQASVADLFVFHAALLARPVIPSRSTGEFMAASRGFSRNVVAAIMEFAPRHFGSDAGNFFDELRRLFYTDREAFDAVMNEARQIILNRSDDMALKIALEVSLEAVSMRDPVIFLASVLVRIFQNKALSPEVMNMYWAMGGWKMIEPAAAE
jgi:hypothetical protein